MVLGFKTRFKDKILSGQKIHTIRRDPTRRWYVGRFIHMATGVRSPLYKEFNTCVCTCVQQIFIDPEQKTIDIDMGEGKRRLDSSEHESFAKNDGFDSENDFWDWFNSPFNGVIIHWSGFSYRADRIKTVEIPYRPLV